jgi:hypothetical protein
VQKWIVLCGKEPRSLLKEHIIYERFVRLVFLNHRRITRLVECIQKLYNFEYALRLNVSNLQPLTLWNITLEYF